MAFDRSGRHTCLTGCREGGLTYAHRARQEFAEGSVRFMMWEDLAARFALRIAMMPTFTTYFCGPLVACSINVTQILRWIW